MKKTFAQIMQEAGETSLKKLFIKVPEWKECAGITVPKSLNAEQCSSSATARFKADIAREACGNERFIADLTGGLGVDSWAFSQVFGHVLHNEMDTELSRAVESNFRNLGVVNCTFSNKELKAGSLAGILGDSVPDILYLDPARRSSDGKKVFLLQDCSPDIISLKEELLGHCSHVLVKISPMADISLVAREIGKELRHVYVCGTRGECKELLLHIEKDWDGGCGISCIDSGERMDFASGHEDAAVHFLDNQARITSLMLFEPGAVLMKSGCMDRVASDFNLHKAGRNTQLYFSDTVIPELKSFGKFFTIGEVLPFSAAEIKNVASRRLQADVTVKALPLSSEELKKRLRTSTGGTEHIFACAMDFSEEKSSRVMLMTSKVL